MAKPSVCFLMADNGHDPTGKLQTPLVLAALRLTANTTQKPPCPSKHSTKPASRSTSQPKLERSQSATRRCSKASRELCWYRTDDTCIETLAPTDHIYRAPTATPKQPTTA